MRLNLLQIGLLALLVMYLMRHKIARAAAYVAPDLGIGTNGSSFLGRTDLPRGIRNNNPGNLRISGNDWVGKVPVAQNTDGAFEQFYAYTYGVRAMIKLIQNYIRAGNDTIASIIAKYAPTSENDTSAYVSQVESSTGISRGAQINPGDRSAMERLIIAMARVENGEEAVTREDFAEAWNLL